MENSIPSADSSSINKVAPKQEMSVEDLRAKQEADLRQRIDSLQVVLDEDIRQLELAESRLGQEISSPSDSPDGTIKGEVKLKILEQSKANCVRAVTENKSKLAKLKEELRQTYR